MNEKSEPCCLNHLQETSKRGRTFQTRATPDVFKSKATPDVSQIKATPTFYCDRIY